MWKYFIDIDSVVYWTLKYSSNILIIDDIEDATINWLKCYRNSKYFPKFNSWSLYFQGSFYTQLGVHTNTLFPVGMNRQLLLISVIFAKESPCINILLATIKLAEMEQWSKQTILQYSRQHKPMLFQSFLFLSNIRYITIISHVLQSDRYWEASMRYIGDSTFLLFQFQVKYNY